MTTKQISILRCSLKKQVKDLQCLNYKNDRLLMALLKWISDDDLIATCIDVGILEAGTGRSITVKDILKDYMDKVAIK